MLLRTLITTVLKAYLTYEAQLSCLKKKGKKKGEKISFCFSKFKNSQQRKCHYNIPMPCC